MFHALPDSADCIHKIISIWHGLGLFSPSLDLLVAAVGFSQSTRVLFHHKAVHFSHCFFVQIGERNYRQVSESAHISAGASSVSDLEEKKILRGLYSPL